MCLRYHESRECQKVLSFRETLPVAGYKAEIHKHVSENQVKLKLGSFGFSGLNREVVGGGAQARTRAFV